MAEVIGIIASAITIGASAAEVSLALFDVVRTLKNAPRQIAEIAEELSSVSASLQSLADVIHINQDVCRPALFQNTRNIISRYKQVDAEIKKLTDTPQKLAGLQWYFNKPKAKGLLKKVEGIKSALILELNIIRLAQEEFTRSFPEVIITPAGLSLKPNRFRKVVESVVQANRKVVENAQQDDKDFSTEEQHGANVVLDLWRQDSFDTATWLYHLVFSPDIPYSSEANAKPRISYQASVTDASDLGDEEADHTRPDADTNEKAMIVWNKQTEPSSVVDRLLSSWTTLSSDQITRSAARQDGDDWRESLSKRIKKAKKEEAKSFHEWEQENEEHEEGPPNGNPTSDDSWDYIAEDSPALDHTRPARVGFGSNTSRQPGVKQQVRWKPHGSSNMDSTPRSHRHKKHRSNAEPPHSDDESTSSSIYPTLDGHTAFTTSIPRRSFPKHFHPSHVSSSPSFGYVPPRQDRLQGNQFPTFDQRPSNPFSNPADASANWASGFPPHYASVPPPAPAPPPPPPPPPIPVPYAQAPSTDANIPSPQRPKGKPHKTETATKEDAIMAAVKDLLEKQEQNKQLDASEPRFLRLMELFNMQQERELQNERERANAATEAQTRLMQAVHDKDNERLKKLETLVEELRHEEKNLRRKWEVETEQRVKEVKDTAAKEIAAVQSAKEEAEKQIQKRIATEQRQLKRDHKKELERYEDRLRELQEQQVKREQDVQLPIRRTRIAEGNRSVDVTEYSTDKWNPFRTSSSHLRGVQYGFAQLGINPKQSQAQHQYSRHSRRDSFHSSTTSTQSSYASMGTNNTIDPAGSSQQLIVFPAKANRTCQKLAKLQSSLASLGIDSRFEDPEYGPGGELIPYNNGDSGDHLVRSTIFWEAPMLILGSELLLTMRQSGWRPAYTRISEKGHTHFLGNQPIHAYFFNPDYKPQFSQSTDPAKESILIHESIVHEYALMELGLTYEVIERGNYVLDGRLTYYDIENLVERSFLMNENHYRRWYRELQSRFNKTDHQIPKSTHPFGTRRSKADRPPASSAASTYSEDDELTSFEDSSYGTEERESSVVSSATTPIHHDSDHSDRASTPGGDKSSVKSSSIILEPSAKNPFRQHMAKARENKHNIEPRSVNTSIWDDPADA